MNVLLFIVGLIIILPALLQTDGEEEYEDNLDVGGDIVLWDNLNKDKNE